MSAAVDGPSRSGAEFDSAWYWDVLRDDPPEDHPEPPAISWVTPDLSLLGSGRRAVPEFPLDLFDPFWASWVEKRAAGASAPVGYVAVALLAAVGASIANVRWPLAGSEWCEPPVLWCAIVGPPSAGKSPAIDPVMLLLGHAEECLAEGFDDQLREFEAEVIAARAVRDGWEADVKAAALAGEMIPPRPAAADEPVRPERPRIRVGDVTAEKLGALAAAHPRGLLVVRDELAGWLGGFDRYGGGGADRALALEAYGGRQYRIDRKKDPVGTIVPHLSIGALGGTQPDKIGLITDGADDGFAARLLWAWPDHQPEFSLRRTVDENGGAQAAFARLAGLAVGTTDEGEPEPKRIRLAPDAEDLLEQFAREMAAAAADADGQLAGTLGKARGHALRLACVIEHLAWSATGGREPETISAHSVTASAALIDGYFIPMARKALGDAAIPTNDRAAMALVRHLKRERLGKFNARQTRRALGGSLRESKVMDAACEQLCEACIIRPAPSSTATAGRHPKDFVVNPIVFGGAS
ncbi:MAG: DUF3987 domain-containing protein [Pseudomonadota bacterium]